MTTATRIGDLPWPGLYVLRDAHREWGGVVETLHIMSTHAGGQIRGYHRERGERAWRIWLPNYTGDWPEMDEAVAVLVGDSVNGIMPGRQRELFA